MMIISMMMMMKTKITVTEPIFKQGPPNFSWQQIMIISIDDDNDDNDDDDDYDDYNDNDDGDKDETLKRL